MLAFVRRLVPPVRNLRSLSVAAPRRQDTVAPSEVKLLEGEKEIHAKLTERFAPSQLEVQDVSGGCGSFYAITIASSAFAGLSIVKQHKLVTETLGKEIAKIHGLQIKTIPQ